MRVARLFGIDIRVHASWLVSLALLSVTARGWIVEDLTPKGSPVARLSLSIAFGVAIVACIVAHELAHSLVAMGHGLPVRTITLFAFGGVSQIEAEATGPGAEYRVALAGPLMSVVLGGAFLGVSRALHPGATGLGGAWGVMGLVNLVLAVFNLIPAFPMDGGRILRSALWAGVRDRARATRWAATAGRAFAGVMIVTGLLFFAHGVVAKTNDSAIGVWNLLLGLFLYNATETASRHEGGQHPNEPPML